MRDESALMFPKCLVSGLPPLTTSASGGKLTADLPGPSISTACGARKTGRPDQQENGHAALQSCILGGTLGDRSGGRGELGRRPVRGILQGLRLGATRPDSYPPL